MFMYIFQNKLFSEKFLKTLSFAQTSKFFHKIVKLSFKFIFYKLLEISLYALDTQLKVILENIFNALGLTVTCQIRSCVGFSTYDDTCVL